jgi:hypothetical protein
MKARLLFSALVCAFVNIALLHADPAPDLMSRVQSAKTAIFQQATGCQDHDFVTLGSQIAAFRLSIQGQGLTDDQIDDLVQGFVKKLLTSKASCNQPAAAAAQPAAQAGAQNPTPAPAAKPTAAKRATQQVAGASTLQQLSPRAPLKTVTASPVHTENAALFSAAGSSPSGPITEDSTAAASAPATPRQHLLSTQPEQPAQQQQAPAQQQQAPAQQQPQSSASGTTPTPADEAVGALARLRQCQVLNNHEVERSQATVPSEEQTDCFTKDKHDVCKVPQEKMDCLNTVLDNKTYFYLEKGNLDAGTEPLASNLAVQAIETDISGQVNSRTIQNKVVFDLTNPTLNFNLPDFKTTRYRIIGGVSVAAASSTTPQAQFLGDASAQFPLSFEKTHDLDSLGWIWGDLRIGSIAQPGALSSLQLSSGLSSYVSPSSAAPSQMVQSIELHSGIDMKLAFTNKSHTPMSVSVIGLGGLITPISTSQFNPVFYQATPSVQSSLEQEYPSLNLGTQFTAACNSTTTSNGTTTTTPRSCYVAFPPADRTTLYHDYGAGIRLKWYWYDVKERAYLFPSIFDITAGQSEYVTGGKFSGAVLHLGGSTPIPQYRFFMLSVHLIPALRENLEQRPPFCSCCRHLERRSTSQIQRWFQCLCRNQIGTVGKLASALTLRRSSNIGGTAKRKRRKLSSYGGQVWLRVRIGTRALA